MSADPLEGPRTKVARARHHFQELGATVTGFLATNPYQVDSGGRLTRVDPVPIQVAGIVGDLLHNLRSALDQIAFQAVSIGLGCAPPRPQDIAYPIADSAEQYLALRIGRVAGARPDALNVIDATKPYRGGNDVLWRIHRLNNVDKHRVLLAVGSAFRAVNLRGMLESTARGFRYTAADGTEKISGSEVTYPDFWLRPADRMCPLEVGKQLATFGVDADKKTEYQFEIALDEPGIVTDAPPLLETVQEMIAEIDGLLPTFAACLK